MRWSLDFKGPLSDALDVLLPTCRDFDRDLLRGTGLNRPLRQLLESWRAAGLTHLPKPRADILQQLSTVLPMVEPVPVAPLPTTSSAIFVEHTVEQVAVSVAAVKVTPPVVPVTLPLMAQNLTTADREQALCQLSLRVAACQKCTQLATARTQTVFGVGNPHAKVLFLGEAPGADEDAQGEPFVGQAGQLLNKIITACGWKREDLYLCNILRCRPPGNRTPEKPEADNCREYLEEQIRIVDPDYIVCWGSCAAQNLLNSVAPIGKLRQQWFNYGRAKVLCTYHPSYLLRNPEAKKPVWDDMKFLLHDMGLTPPTQ